MGQSVEDSVNYKLHTDKYNCKKIYSETSSWCNF